MQVGENLISVLPTEIRFKQKDNALNLCPPQMDKLSNLSMRGA